MKWNARIGIAVMMGGLLAVGLRAQQAPAETAGAGDPAALRLFRQGLALIEDRQDERGLKLLASIPSTFPKSPVRLQAWLAIGRYYTERKPEYALALKNLQPVLDAEDAGPDEKAEALYRMGIAHYGLGDYPRALATLRKVTDQYPWSIFANEAYYYIGLCHFQVKRWRQAVDALKMVGTSILPNEGEEESLVEAGQRFFVKIQDKDLRVLKIAGRPLEVTVTTDSGDREMMTLEPFDPDGEFYLGSLRMEQGKASPTNGVLEVRGGDRLSIAYGDANTRDGARNVERKAFARTVSTAVAGFTDGAYREYVKGLFAGQPAFVRVKDLDADVTDAPDTLTVRLVARTRAPRDESAPPSEIEELVDRDSITLTLKESGPMTGVFTGMLQIHKWEEGQPIETSDSTLSAAEKDMIFIEYEDRAHIGSRTEPRLVTARAEFLTGEIPDVMVAQREVSTEELRARKNVTEAKFYLRLSQIFKDVGLTARSHEKADVGLEKVEDVLRRYARSALPPELVEEAYQIKWELQIIKDDLTGAIATARQLMALFPTSSLADMAMMKIARAHLEAGKPSQAAGLLRGILGLKTSPEIKAEAQFLLAQTLEKSINPKLEREERLRALGQAIAAYRAVAEQYPDSPFAGEALGKVIDFHLEARDYARCLEMIQTVFQDYPDAPFLDEMLLKWGVVLVRLGRPNEAREKLTSLIRDYPNSAAAGKAQKVLELINR